MTLNLPLEYKLFNNSFGINVNLIKILSSA
jgi:hypothetical protein